MLVRLEKTSDPLIVLVVDENEKYIGKIPLGVFHKYTLTSEEILIEDDYEYYTVDKEKIIKYCKK